MKNEHDVWQSETMIVRTGSTDVVEISTEIELDELLLPGQILSIYHCEKLLGRGGMGVVYLARNTSLQRLCALKLLSPRRTRTEIDYVARFENEGRAGASQRCHDSCDWPCRRPSFPGDGICRWKLAAV